MWGELAVFNWAVRGGLAKKVTFGQGVDGGGGVCHHTLWGRAFQAEGAASVKVLRGQGAARRPAG